METGVTTLVSLFESNPVATGVDSFFPSMSADGTTIAYRTIVSGCEFCDTNSQVVVFDSEPAPQRTEVLPRAVDGDFDGNADDQAIDPTFEPGAPSVSADGLHVAFQAVALVESSQDDALFVYNRTTNTLERVDALILGGAPVPLPGTVSEPAISGNGRHRRVHPSHSAADAAALAEPPGGGGRAGSGWRWQLRTECDGAVRVAVDLPASGRCPDGLQRSGRRVEPASRHLERRPVRRVHF